MNKSRHIGRSTVGHHVEDRCPCPKAPCGLVVESQVVEECLDHPIQRRKTLRQVHTATECPSGMSAGERLNQILAQAGISHGEMAALADAWRAEHAEEVLREAAAKIRAAGCQEVNWCGCPVAADLIDPDKDSA